jgi:hypothetical protein
MIHVLLPTQNLCPAGPRAVEPHKRLMAAVLQAAVDDCRGSLLPEVSVRRRPVSPRDVRRAVAYVASTDRRWPFSFENLCEALQLDMDRLRRELVDRRSDRGP